MTEQHVQARLAELKAQADQLRANLNAVAGAIQDCEYWLEQFQLKTPAGENDGHDYPDNP
jgi:hypothetical protein